MNCNIIFDIISFTFLVLGWETALELWVPLAFFSYSLLYNYIARELNNWVLGTILL